MALLDQNIIGRCDVDFSFHGDRDAITIRNEAESLTKEKLLPAIEQLIENINLGNSTLRINHLEVEVTGLDSRNWKKQLEEKTRIAFTQILSEKISNASKSSELIHLSKHEATFESFLFFVGHGYVPWWSSNISSEEWRQQVAQLFSIPLSETEISQLRTSWQQENERIRFVQLIPSSIFWSIIRQIVADSVLLKQIEKDFEILVAGSDSSIVRQAESNWKEYILHQIAAKKILSANEVSHELTQELKVLEPGLLRSLKTISWESVVFKYAVKRISEIKSAEQKSVKKKITRKESVIDDGSEIYIDNAGLVIIATYLPRFFKKLNMVNEENEITDPSVAVCLLQYLVAGKEERNEFELVLPKLLCGMQIADVVNTGIRLSSEQKQESEVLLESAIEHWAVLKNTSVDGLRNSFLQRAGKLTWQQGKWKMIVEEKGFDLLIDYLPWQFRMIKLPWMPWMLEVNWR